jgi:exosortase/archaeosortase family protein
MELTRGLKGLWASLPSEASAFLVRALLLFIGWKLLYILLLLPLGEPDGWLVRRLGEATVMTLNVVFGEERYRVVHVAASQSQTRPFTEACALVYRSGSKPDIGIFTPCNGLELMVLGVGFILCFDGTWRKRMLYVSAVLSGVFVVNVLRCCLLTVIKTDHPAYFEFAHKYLFNLAGYGFVFLLWMKYVKGSMEEG